MSESCLRNSAELDLENYTLIISDWYMPSMSGMQLLEHIRRQSRLEKTPFILLTKEADKESVLAAKGAGITHYLAKPFNSNELERKLLDALGTRPQG